MSRGGWRVESVIADRESRVHGQRSADSVGIIWLPAGPHPRDLAWGPTPTRRPASGRVLLTAIGGMRTTRSAFFIGRGAPPPRPRVGPSAFAEATAGQAPPREDRPPAGCC